MPVPTSGVSVRSVGTAWRCMFEPINARFASSCSRNGISDAATDTICFGETSMYWILSGAAAARTRSGGGSTRGLPVNSPFGDERRVRLRDHVLALLDRRQVIDLGR